MNYYIAGAVFVAAVLVARRSRRAINTENDDMIQEEDISPRLLDRVIFIGPSSSGKSTAAKRLAKHAHSTYICLDYIHYHKGDWQECDAPEFKQLLTKFIEEANSLTESRWTTDGHYFRKGTEELLWKDATCVVWLDFPFWFILACRLLPRTIQRVISREELWGIPGLYERWSNFWAKDGIIFYTVRNFASKRVKLAAKIAEYDSTSTKFYRFHHPRELESWLRKAEKVLQNLK